MILSKQVDYSKALYEKKARELNDARDQLKKYSRDLDEREFAQQRREEDHQ